MTVQSPYVKGAAAWRRWQINGVVGRTWEKIQFDGTFRFIALPLAVLSAR
jgi:hypothetical protein